MARVRRKRPQPDGRHGTPPKRRQIGVCPTEKRGYTSVAAAKKYAHDYSRYLLSAGVWVESMYVYRCDRCAAHHLTRQATHRGVALQQVLIAPPRAAQLWAMPEPRRAAAEAARPEE